MTIIEIITAKAKKLQASIVFPEWQDHRVIQAVCRLAADQTVKPVLVGPPDEIKQHLKQVNPAVLEHIRIIDPATAEYAKELAYNYYTLRRDKGLGFFEAKQAVQNPLVFGALLVSLNLADGMVGGAAHSTADMVRAALRGIGTKPGISKVSSTVLLVSPHHELGDNGVVFFADCAVIPDPSPQELSDIAIATAQTARSLLDLEPRIAFLSFSTKGSAKHKLIEKVVKATELTKQRAPNLILDGELQLDAALVPSVCESKAPKSPIKGRANILIFPDINAANIAYKTAQRFGKAEALGPILQGFKQPVNDLSRGCSVDDIVNVAAVTALQLVSK